MIYFVFNLFICFSYDRHELYQQLNLGHFFCLNRNLERLSSDRFIGGAYREQ